MRKSKDVNQLFREGLKTARLGLAASRGHYVTPAEIGAEVGVTGQTIRSYESGATEPTLEMIERLAGVLGVRLGWPPFGDISGLPIEEDSEPLGISRKPQKQKGARG